MMRMRSATLFALSIAAVVIPVGCGGSTHNAGSNSTGTGGSAAHGTGTTVTVGSGSGGSSATSMGPTTSSSGSANTTASSSSSSTSGGGTYPAPFPPPPQVADLGGMTLSGPKIYPVFFPNDDPNTVASLADFSMHIGGTSYWTATTSEYGVGPATGMAPIKIAQPAPGQIDDSQIQQWLAQEFATNPAFPVPDANTLVILYYPAGTTITLQGRASCQVFGGYHQGVTVGNNVTIAYAVVPRCASVTMTTLDMTTGSASHELIEAATDPRPGQDPAYAQVDDADIVWELSLGGGEVGDLCAQFPDVFTMFPGFNYTVQRTWSNKAVKAGKDPCQPELPGEVYFNAAPVLPDMVPITIQGQMVTIRAVKVQVGTPKTIPVQLWSEGPTAPWTVTVSNLSNTPHATLSLDKAMGQNGDVFNLTITVPAGTPTGHLEPFIVKSVSSSQPQHGDWFGAIVY
jgi:hypothetical protein